ncbi:MAG: TrmH family RNA methyltransferase, partial [Brachymonas sp.]|nr:TrmH family RNA methyltransferase [Brachymonas sp.]
YARVLRYPGWQGFWEQARPDPQRLFALTTQGRRSLHDAAFAAGDWLLFGRETTGLPHEVVDACQPANRLRLPMRPGQRSLNLSNAVAVSVFEAWRQTGFEGAV